MTHGQPAARPNLNLHLANSPILKQLSVRKIHFVRYTLSFFLFPQQYRTMYPPRALPGLPSAPRYGTNSSIAFLTEMIFLESSVWILSPMASQPGHQKQADLLLLQNILSCHRRSSPFTLIQDTLEQPATNMLRRFIREAKVCEILLRRYGKG